MTQLSGKVAIVRDGVVLEIRDLGPTPVDVKPGVVFPYVEEHPALAEGEQETGPAYVIEATQVRGVWRKKTAQEIADETAAAKDAELQGFSIIGRRALFNHESWLRALTGRPQAPQQAFNAALIDLLENPAPVVDPTKVVAIVKFAASVTIGSVAGAGFTDKTFTIPGLLAGDLVLSVIFDAGLSPATIGYVPLRVSAADTLVIRFMKIATGAVTPPAGQAMTVLIGRPGT